MRAEEPVFVSLESGQGRNGLGPICLGFPCPSKGFGRWVAAVRPFRLPVGQ